MASGKLTKRNVYNTRTPLVKKMMCSSTNNLKIVVQKQSFTNCSVLIERSLPKKIRFCSRLWSVLAASSDMTRK